MDVRKHAAVPIFIVLSAGFLALAVAMGIGRFAYTPILPLMQAGEGFSEAAAGLIAMANYGGYFLAALFSSYITKFGGRTVWLRTHLLLSVLTTGFMGWWDHAAAWGVIRFLSGWSSGVVFVLSTNIVLDRLLSERRHQWLAGFLYGGVGLGIAFSGLAVPLLSRWEGWRGAWWGLMVFGALAVPLIWYGLREAGGPSRPRAVAVPAVEKGASMIQARFRPGRYGWLVAAYGLEGLGYIVSGTFLVAAVVSWPELAPYGNFSWVLVGLAAAPSTIVWSLLARRFGEQRVLLSAYLLQAVGVVMPVLLPHWLTVFLGALLFGGTFMGIVTLAMNLGRRLASDQGRVVGQLTTAYSLGQMIGPAVAGVMATWTGGYALPLVFAGVVVLAGAGALLPLMMGGRDERSELSMPR